jgi:uncharacterized C2H2 Zn-finger protein
MVAIQAAKIVTVQGRRWWRCPECDKTLGEVVGGRVVVRRRDFSGEFGVDGSSQRCPKCGAISAPTDHAKLAA